MLYTQSIQGRQAGESDKMVDRAVEHVRSKLLSGELVANSRLSEVALAKEIGVSRTPVREAMIQLRSAGLVDQLPRYGWFVRALDRQDLIELYEVRELLECFAAGKAAEQATPQQISLLRASINQWRSLTRELMDQPSLATEPSFLQRSTRIDLAFHELIIDLSGNTWVGGIARQVGLLSRVAQAKHRNVSVMLDQAAEESQEQQESTVRQLKQLMISTLRQHHLIFRAIRKHNPDLARERMAIHIRLGLESTLRQIG